MAKEFPTQKEIEREARERVAIARAKRTGESVTYVDDDGCEVTATPGGHAFYNAADWY